MLKTDATWKAGIISNGRQFKYRFQANGVDDIPASAFTSVEIDECGASEQTLKCGEFCKNSITFNVLTSAYNKWRGGYLQAWVSCNGSAEVSLGKYFIYKQELKDDGRYTTITGYDVPEYMLEKAAPASQSVSEIVAAIEKDSGMTITNKDVFTLSTITAVPENTTNMGLLGYIAGYDGYNLRTNREGGIEAYRYEDSADILLVPREDLYPSEELLPGRKPIDASSPLSGYVVPRRNTYQGSQSYAATPINIDSVTVVSGDTSYTAGSGTGITYENPYITSADQIDRSYIHTSYIPLDNRWRGNPAVQIGDVLMVETAAGTYQRTLVMEQKLSIDVGFSATLCSYGETDSAIAVESPTMREIKTVKKQLSNALVNALSVILGTGAGYFNFVDAEGNVITDANTDDTIIAGWQITDSPNVGDTTKGWRFILGGLYYSADGFKTAKNFALTKDGQIVATSGTFGEYPNTVELRTNDAKTGVLFDGTGTVDYKTVGRFNAENTSVVTSQSASIIRMANDTANNGRNYINLMNYNLLKTAMADDYYKYLANAVYITANKKESSGNTLRFQNYIEPTTADTTIPATANQILISSTNNGLDNSVNLYNYDNANNVRNKILLTAHIDSEDDSKSKNRIELVNAQPNYNSGNWVLLSSEKDKSELSLQNFKSGVLQNWIYMVSAATNQVAISNCNLGSKQTANYFWLNTTTDGTNLSLINNVPGLATTANKLYMESTSKGNSIKLSNYLNGSEATYIEMRSDGYLGLVSGRFYISVDQFDLYIGGKGYTGLSFIDDGKGHAVLGKA